MLQELHDENTVCETMFRYLNHISFFCRRFFLANNVLNCRIMFFLNCNVYKQNCRYWSDKNFQIFWEGQRQWKFNIWILELVKMHYLLFMYWSIDLFLTVELGTKIDAENNLGSQNVYSMTVYRLILIVPSDNG